MYLLKSVQLCSQMNEREQSSTGDYKIIKLGNHAFLKRRT